MDGTHEIAAILGPALDVRREQAAWREIVAWDKANRGLRSPSFVPLRGFCLVGSFALMRPKNNKALTWEELTLDPVSRSGWFELADHRNRRKGITARGSMHPRLVEYLLRIRPANASGLVHPNPATGLAYVDIRKQWDHLIEIASRLLGYRLEGKKADFFNFRHSGASHIAACARDARHLLGVVRMMGDTSIATVNRHYFNSDEDTLREIIAGWTIPEVVDVYESFHLPLAS